MPGETIAEAATEMARMANRFKETVTATFNDISVTCEPGTHPKAITDWYASECNRRREAYINSDAYKEQRAKAAEEYRVRKLKLDEALLAAPASMTLRDPEAWKVCCEANTDGYGGAVIQYAELWARLMEARLAHGGTISDSADEASNLADTDIGITGFMYGCAVSILSEVWIYGEELRRWHNLKTQIGNEGEKANESGGVLNPALLNVRRSA